MLDNLSAYKIWAPNDSIWSAWVKPVIFTSKYLSNTNTRLKARNIDFIYNKNTLCIVDLPGEESVEVGMGLAEVGYRPIPLYNGVKGPINAMLIDVTQLENYLYQGASYLSALQLSSSANPVFLLDSRRMDSKSRVPGVFDNRWSIFPQDMPSANFLKKHGISKVVLFSEIVRDDLSHILFSYQKEGIQIYSFKGEKQINVKRPMRYRSYLYRFLVTFGLRRNAAGGFGGTIPDAVQSGSGRRYYGIG